MAEVTLTDAQNGAQVSVRVGDTISIRLSENSAAGYRWTMSPFDDRIISLASQDYEPASAAVGGAGTALWRLKAKKSGTTRVELKKARPWESKNSDASFAVNLNIREE